nr:carboxylesterase family protein [uncultured Sphingomonas sp.]
MDPVVRTTESGPVRGACSGGLCTFLGIPYAAPPVGPLRFAEPEPAEPWTGERDATDPGPPAPHRIRDFPGLDVVPLVGRGGEEGGDYLRLNIWAPESGDKLPVMLFIHGGGFVVGSKDAPVHNGSAFARSGVVCVAINYRLGIDGFLPIEGVPTNLGLRDMIFAMHWVQRNIAAFGGDPDNVTLFGESAGAMAIADLITSPLTNGLIRRAIVQSGHGAMVRDMAVAKRLSAKLAAMLGIKPTRDGFASVPFTRAWAAMEKLAKPFARIDLRDAGGNDPVFGISRFIPVCGDDVLPLKPLEALRAGAGKDVELLIGSNAAEMNLYFVPTGVKRKLPGWLAWLMLRRSHARPAAVLQAYRGPGKRPGEVFTDALTDMVFRWPARRFAEEHQGRTHVYEFDWHSPACGGELGACHGIELPFVFKALDTVSGKQGLAGEGPPQELAERTHALWVRFATDGSLPWGEFDREGRTVHRLAEDVTISEPVMPAAPFLP